jgi:predicted nucleotidyltransferase
VTSDSALAIDKVSLATFCRKAGIRRLALFGSALTSEFGPDSDVDLVAEFEPDRLPGLIGLAELEHELERIFGGREVELRTFPDLNPRFRERVRREAQELYGPA